MQQLPPLESAGAATPSRCPAHSRRGGRARRLQCRGCGATAGCRPGPSAHADEVAEGAQAAADLKGGGGVEAGGDLQAGSSSGKEPWRTIEEERPCPLQRAGRNAATAPTSSAKSTLEGPTSISPLVTRLRCPPLMPRIIELPCQGAGGEMQATIQPGEPHPAVPASPGAGRLPAAGRSHHQGVGAALQAQRLDGNVGRQPVVLAHRLHVPFDTRGTQSTVGLTTPRKQLRQAPASLGHHRVWRDAQLLLLLLQQHLRICTRPGGEVGQERAQWRCRPSQRGQE